MAGKVCEGKFGLIQKDDRSKERVEGLELDCPDQPKRRFVGGSRKEAFQGARRFLVRNGYTAQIKDELR